jgi:hypothetical protein
MLIAGKDPALDQAAVQVQLHVAGALELLEDDLVHAAAGVDERRRDDREAAAALDIARGAEEPLRLLQRGRLQAARHDLAGIRGQGVVGAREPGDRIEQDDDVLPLLDQRRAFSPTISAQWTWLSGASSKVEETTSPLVWRLKSVTSSGRSSISSRISFTSGLFSETNWRCSGGGSVLPVRGGATMSPRWPKPIGVRMSTARIETSFWTSGASSRIRCSG